MIDWSVLIKPENSEQIPENGAECRNKTGFVGTVKASIHAGFLNLFRLFRHKMKEIGKKTKIIRPVKVGLQIIIAMQKRIL